MTKLQRFSYTFRGLFFILLAGFILWRGNRSFGLEEWQVYTLGTFGLILGLWRIVQVVRSY